MVKPKIEDVRLRTVITPEGTFEEMYEVSYMIERRRYLLTIPKEEFTTQEAKRRVNEEAKKIIELLGMPFEPLA